MLATLYEVTLYSAN